MSIYKNNKRKVRALGTRTFPPYPIKGNTGAGNSGGPNDL